MSFAANTKTTPVGSDPVSTQQLNVPVKIPGTANDNTTGLSEIIDLDGCIPIGLIVPASIAGLPGSAATIKAGRAADAMMDVYDVDGVQAGITVGASRYITLKPSDFPGFTFFQLAFAGGTPTANTKFYLMVRKLSGAQN